MMYRKKEGALLHHHLLDLLSFLPPFSSLPLFPSSSLVLFPSLFCPLSSSSAISSPSSSSSFYLPLSCLPTFLLPRSFSLVFLLSFSCSSLLFLSAPLTAIHNLNPSRSTPSPLGPSHFVSSTPVRRTYRSSSSSKSFTTFGSLPCFFPVLDRVRTKS